jgi:AraC family transcriptional regulator of adaptative response / DNA-3-methyladenine glycosylase II
MPTRTIQARLAAREPYAGRPLLDFLAARAVPGVEAVEAGTYRRTLRLPGGPAVLAATPGADGRLRLELTDPGDQAEAERLVSHLLDLDAEPEAVDLALGADPLLAPLVARRPGLRVPGHVDGFELAVRAVLGQQVTVKGAGTLAGRLVARLGQPLAGGDPALTHLFPTAAAVAAGDLSGLGLTGARIRALRALAGAVASGTVMLGPGADRAEAGRALLALPGIGPWTVAYVAMRALGDRDAIPLGDLGLRQAMADLAGPATQRALAERAERWRPWRAYAAMHLWAHLASMATPRAGARRPARDRSRRTRRRG